MGSNYNIMDIPEKCSVLVIGGGPGGSYTASVLAREGIDTVLLEAEKMPRYHIGESMLPSFRHYLKFIDLHTVFDNYGFTRKNGAAFKMNPQNREGFTDFLAVGEENYAWNVVRSEADEILFRHAGKSGAKIFDGVKVLSVDFEAHGNGHAEGNGDKSHASTSTNTPGRPVSATWSAKEGGRTGTVKFDYIVDATGRNGLLSTTYLKNRSFSTALKNVANWAYFTGGGLYGKGTRRANAPFFEALRDESGWAWFIPLHNGTHSIGVVMNQDIATKKKQALETGQQYFEGALKQAPMIMDLLGPEGKQASAIRSASDYSYHATSYAFPYARIVGDAGCFIDPFFSSGVHLAVTGALSAGTTIAASIRGDCDEDTAAQWHSNKIREGYARFLLVVLSAYNQMRNQSAPLLSDLGEDNFDRAFSFFRPVIQGAADASDKLTQAELNKTVDFLTKAFAPAFHPGEENKEGSNGTNSSFEFQKVPGLVSEEDLEALTAMRSHHGADTTSGMARFSTDVVDGRVPRLERGNLTLVTVESA